jgi:hypothetical protein
VAAHGQQLLLKASGSETPTPCPSSKSQVTDTPESRSSAVFKKRKVEAVLESLLNSQQECILAENEYRAEILKLKKEKEVLADKRHEDEMRMRREELEEKRKEREMVAETRMAELKMMASILSGGK